jgi:creatinine amidohydrolase
MRYSDETSPDLRDRFAGGVTVLLPTGSVEQHGPHLPVGTDAMIAEALAHAVVERLSPDCLVLPALWYGFAPHHMSFSGTVTLAAETYLALVRDISRSVISHGVSQLVILNGHGGNVAPLRMLSAELARDCGRAPLIVTYWETINREIHEIFAEPELVCGHACALETSLALHLFPQLVRRQAIPAGRSGESGPHMFGTSGAFEGLDFGRFSANGVIGDPSLASPEVGARLFTLLTDKLTSTVAQYLRRQR